MICDDMMSNVRTTVTLDPDTELIIRRRMKERGVSFKQAINDAIRSSITGSVQFKTETAAMGQPTVNLDRALQLVGELEDDEMIRKARAGS